MKKYKTWEAFELLTNNSYLKFRHDIENEYEDKKITMECDDSFPSVPLILYETDNIDGHVNDLDASALGLNDEWEMFISKGILHEIQDATKNMVANPLGEKPFTKMQLEVIKYLCEKGYEFHNACKMVMGMKS
jgi:hypothetical protein